MGSQLTLISSQQLWTYLNQAQLLWQLSGNQAETEQKYINEPYLPKSNPSYIYQIAKKPFYWYKYSFWELEFWISNLYRSTAAWKIQTDFAQTS